MIRGFVTTGRVAGSRRPSPRDPKGLFWFTRDDQFLVFKLAASFHLRGVHRHTKVQVSLGLFKVCGNLSTVSFRYDL